MAWAVLDTEFSDGCNFLDTWLAWRRDPLRPRLLHYVGIKEIANPAQASISSQNDRLWACSDERDLFQTLQSVVGGLDAGFNRVLLDDGKVSLTICLGQTDIMLGEQAFQADTVFGSMPQNKWNAQLLARRCKRGTRVALSAPTSCADETNPRENGVLLLRSAGFQIDTETNDQPLLCARFDPRWNISTSRSPIRHWTQAPGRCAVVGAGLAGASIANALALRGWQITVLDQEATPASGASGLPAALAVPHVSSDDSPRSRLTRSGIRLMVQHAEQLLLRRQDWDQPGVAEQRPGGETLWHPTAAWIKPAKLVQAWLSHPNITFVGNQKVASLSRTHGLWGLRDTQGDMTGQFEQVIVANAMGSTALLKLAEEEPDAGTILDNALLDKLNALQAIYGTLSHGTYAELIPDLPAMPVNGNGYFIPHVSGTAAEEWVAGSTFETDLLTASDVWRQHELNMMRLSQLLPGVGTAIAETLDRGPVTQWTSTRCVTHDRLPLVGPVGNQGPTGLWLCVGMGSRGVSLSALCAQLLVARLCGEPLPLEFSLSRSLDANRVRRKQQARV